ncbi:MAG: FCD domain-containing protein, partial [Rhodospirillaceae bacterium]
LEPLRATLAALDLIVAESVDGEPAFEEYVRLNGQFHEQMIDLARSPMLRRSLMHVESLPFASPNAFVQVQAQAVHRNEILLLGQAHHRSILEAISEGEGTRAEALAREHARLARRNLALVQERLDLMSQVPGSTLVIPLSAETTKPPRRKRGHGER